MAEVEREECVEGRTGLLPMMERQGALEGHCNPSEGTGCTLMLSSGKFSYEECLFD